MAFVRKRGDSHQLIETYRDGGKVKQRVIANLGHSTTPEEALRHDRVQLQTWGGILRRAEQRGPRGGGRLARSHQKALADHRRRVEKWRGRVAVLEGVVSEMSRRPTNVDTTETQKTKEERGRLNVVHWCGYLTGDNLRTKKVRLSGLQVAILQTILAGCNIDSHGTVSRSEMLVAIHGWKPIRPLRYSKQEADKFVGSHNDHIRAGDIKGTNCSAFAQWRIGKRKYQSVQASLSRALTRLENLGLVGYWPGYGFWEHGRGYKLTDEGLKVARQIAYPTVCDAMKTPTGATPAHEAAA